MPNDAVVVLAHGGWADGSSWAKVIAGLRAEGVKAVAAHAYAGAVIAATSSAQVTALVYVTALAPDEGETVGDVYYWAEHHPQAPALGPDRHGLIWLPEDAFGTAFAQHASPLEQALLAATQRPLAVACIGVPVPRPLWQDRPSWFFVAEQDRMIPAQTQRYMAERMRARVHAAAADHVPMITKAPAVVEVLMEAVNFDG